MSCVDFEKMLLDTLRSYVICVVVCLPQAVVGALGPGKIQKKPIEEAFLIPDFSVC